MGHVQAAWEGRGGEVEALSAAAELLPLGALAQERADDRLVLVDFYTK